MGASPFLRVGRWERRDMESPPQWGVGSLRIPAHTVGILLTVRLTMGCIDMRVFRR